MFSESRGLDTPQTVLPRTRNTKNSGIGKKQLSESERTMQQSFEARNKAVEFLVLCQTESNLGNNLRELKAAKRKLLG